MQDGHSVKAGHILATQLTTRFHPGLNVSILIILQYFTKELFTMLIRTVYQSNISFLKTYL